jgi:hypothetical protein
MCEYMRRRRRRRRKRTTARRILAKSYFMTDEYLT